MILRVQDIPASTFHTQKNSNSVKCKFHTATYHEVTWVGGEEVEEKTYSSLTSMLEGDGLLRAPHGHFTQEMTQSAIVQEDGWAPWVVLRGVLNLPTKGIRSPDYPVHSQSSVPTELSMLSLFLSSEHNVVIKKMTF